MAAHGVLSVFLKLNCDYLTYSRDMEGLASSLFSSKGLSKGFWGRE